METVNLYICLGFVINENVGIWARTNTSIISWVIFYTQFKVIISSFKSMQIHLNQIIHSYVEDDTHAQSLYSQKTEVEMVHCVKTSKIGLSQDIY